MEEFKITPEMEEAYISVCYHITFVFVVDLLTYIPQIKNMMIRFRLEQDHDGKKGDLAYLLG